MEDDLIDDMETMVMGQPYCNQCGGDVWSCGCDESLSLTQEEREKFFKGVTGRELGGSSNLKWNWCEYVQDSEDEEC